MLNIQSSSRFLEQFLILVKSSFDAVNPAELVSRCLRLDLDNSSKKEFLNVTTNILNLAWQNLAKKIPVNHNVYVVAFGKAALGMSAAVEGMMGQTHVVEGIAVVPYNDAIQFLEQNPKNENQISHLTNQFYPLKTPSRIKYFYGAKNNLPDLDSLNAAIKVFEMCQKLKESDILLTLISGGGSALLSLPVEIASNDQAQNLDIKLKTIKSLVNCGANINELNTVRSCLSRLKAGKLAALAHSAKIVSLIISDVIDDPLDIIASGPTCTQLLQSNSSLREKALNIIHKYNLKIPPQVLNYLENMDDNEQNQVEIDACNFLIGNNKLATNSILDTIEKKGFEFDFKSVLTNSLSGEAKHVGSAFACLLVILFKYKLSFVTRKNEQLILEIFQCLKKNLTDLKFHAEEIANIVEKLMNIFFKENDGSFRRICLVSGGETTVNLIDSKGLGGRNQELTLSFEYTFNQLFALENFDFEKLKLNCLFSSYGTDGIDGPTDAAGAYFFFDSSNRQNVSSLNDMKTSLLNHDSYEYFQKRDRLLKSGPTGTNVSDVQILLAEFQHFSQ